MCIVTCCNLPFEVQEAIIDYSTSLLGFSLFSSLCGIIIEITPDTGYPKPDIIKSLQLAGLKSAALIAEWTHSSSYPDSIKFYQINKVAHYLPGAIGILELAGGADYPVIYSMARQLRKIFARSTPMNLWMALS